ncbi:transglycosylase SLT domain-containing protein [bacterium]|nr:transglycosylase SLT domain-containing protein [bacterium]
MDTSKALAAAPIGVAAALRSASASTGVDFGFLVRTAARESGFDANAKASSSSATGLFQFTEGTWLTTLERYGEAHGVDAASLSRSQQLALRTDPELASRMAAELTRENASILSKRIGREPNGGELYAAHFLGAAGAAKLINALEGGDGTADAAALFPSAAHANPSIFRNSAGSPATLSDLYAKLTAAHGAGSAQASTDGTATSAQVQPVPGFAGSPRADQLQLSVQMLALLFELQSETLRDGEHNQAAERDRLSGDRSA